MVDFLLNFSVQPFELWQYLNKLLIEINNFVNVINANPKRRNIHSKMRSIKLNPINKIQNFKPSFRKTTLFFAHKQVMCNL